MRVVHIDVDRTGSSSISHLVRSGHVQTFRCPDFKAAEGVMWGLYRKQITGDLAVLDGLTTLAGVARQDLVMEPSQAKLTPIWDNREKLVAQRQDYYKTADVVNRLLRPLRELDIPTIFVAHERQRTDPLSGLDKYVPDLQREINANLFANADAIVRLAPAVVPFELGGYNVPVGTRLLILSATGDSAAGVRVSPDKAPPPPLLVGWQPYEPTFAQFVAAIGGEIPHNTVLYGPPKIGKTTFSGSAVYL